MGINSVRTIARTTATPSAGSGASEAAAPIGIRHFAAVHGIGTATAGGDGSSAAGMGMRP